MGGHHLAIYNFGLHVDDYDSPRVEGFRLREPLNFEAANRAEGFVGRSGYEGEPGPASRAEARSAAEEQLQPGQAGG